MDVLNQGTADIDVISNGHPGTEFWIASIMECWRASVESIIKTGQRLNEAKAALVHGDWEEVRSGLPFGERQVQMLMAIAADARLSNPQYVALLPASWGTIYDLTRLDDDELKRGFQQRIIRPDMIRADVDQLRPLLQESHAKATEGKAGTAGVDDPVRRSTAGTGLQVGEASADLPATSEIMDVTAGETAPISAPMPSGGLAIAHQRIEPADSLDFFPTPLWATRALIEHVFAHLERKGHCEYQIAWEPACGEGHMAEPLREYFRDVLATDIKDYGYGGDSVDFLKSGLGNHADWIITNPPFNISADFVLKAIELAGTGVAMFVRLTWLESVDRYERIFREHPPTLLAIFSERVPLHKDRWEDKGTTMTAYVWLVWIKGAEPRAPFWIPPGCRKSLTNPDDAARFGAVKEGEAA